MKHLLPLLVIATLGLSACDTSGLEDAFENFVLEFNVEDQNTVIGAAIVDAKTGEFVTAQNVTVRVTDPALTGLLTNAFGFALESNDIDVRDGQFNISIDNDIVPSEANPVLIPIQIDAQGYLPQRRVIALTDTGLVGRTIKLVSPSAPPAGVAVKSATINQSTPTAVTADPDGDAAPTTVTVPAGAQLQDENGTTLAGQAEVQVTVFDPTANSFDEVPESDAPAGQQDVAFNVTNIRASVGDDQASQVSGDPQIEFSIPDGVINPNTGQPVAAGDVVTLARFDEEAGNWVDEGSLTVAAGKNGTVVVGRFQFVGFYCVYVRVQVPAQDITITVNRNGNTGALRAAAYAYGFSADRTIGANSSSTTLKVPASGTRYRTGVFFRNNFISAANQGTCTNCTVDLPQAAPTVTVTLRPVCANSSEGVYFTNVPPFTVSVRRQGGTNWFQLSKKPTIVRDPNSATPDAITALTLTTQLLRPNTTYDVRGRYLNQSYNAVFAVTGTTVNEDFDAPSSVCQ